MNQVVSFFKRLLSKTNVTSPPTPPIIHFIDDIDSDMDELFHPDKKVPLRERVARRVGEFVNKILCAILCMHCLVPE